MGRKPGRIYSEQLHIRITPAERELYAILTSEEMRAALTKSAEKKRRLQ